MKKKTLGEIIKINREFFGFTTYQLGELVGVTNAYISKIENGSRLPSKKIMFILARILGVQKVKYTEDGYEVIETELTPSDDIIKEYAEVKEYDEGELLDEFEAYLNKHNENVTKRINDEKQALKDNRVEYARNVNRQIYNVTEKPYYDLKWLLTQKKFEVFYGKEYDFYRPKNHDYEIRNFSTQHYNIMNEDDLKMIHNIIEEILSNKYEKYSKEYYDNLFKAIKKK